MIGRNRILVCLLCLTATGCHVVEKAQQCEALASIMKDAEPQLAPRLPDFPSSQALKHKASLFHQLAEALKKQEIENPEVRRARDHVVKALADIESGLLEAEGHVKDERIRADQARERQAAVEKKKKEAAEKARAAAQQKAKEKTGGGAAVEAAVENATTDEVEATEDDAQREDAAPEDQSAKDDAREEDAPDAGEREIDASAPNREQRKEGADWTRGKPTRLPRPDPRDPSAVGKPVQELQPASEPEPQKKPSSKTEPRPDRHAPSSAKPLSSAPRQLSRSVYRSRYARSKRDLDAATGRLKGALDSLEAACR